MPCIRWIPSGKPDGANTAEMLCCDSPPKCRAFIIICCYMLSQHNINTTSLKGLMTCKDVLQELILSTAGLTTGFDAIEAMSKDFNVEIDPSVIDECRSMLTVMNRLMCRQLSELKHRQLMGIVSSRAEMEIGRMRRSLSMKSDLQKEAGHERN